jgi:hypothetical protein
MYIIVDARGHHLLAIYNWTETPRNRFVASIREDDICLWFYDLLTIFFFKKLLILKLDVVQFLEFVTRLDV